MSGGEPELEQVDLSIEQVRALVADLASHAGAVEVLVKGAATEHAGAGRAWTLEDVPAIVEGRTARGVQVRYRYDGAEWTDTLLLLSAGGARLVRVRHQI